MNRKEALAVIHRAAREEWEKVVTNNPEFADKPPLLMEMTRWAFVAGFTHGAIKIEGHLEAARVAKEAIDKAATESRGGSA
jgi:hypothetical protein